MRMQFPKREGALAWPMFLITAALVAAACSSEEGEVSDRDPTPPPGTPAPPPALPDGGAVEPGTPVDDAGHPCDPREVRCDAIGACVEACVASCAGAPAECVLCPSSAGPASRMCASLELGADGVMKGCPVDRRCPCKGAGECVGASQVCFEGRCRACGEVGTEGLECPNGRTCVAGRCGR